MVCLACGAVGPARLCGGCRLLLRPAPDRPVPTAGVVKSAFRHEGPARQLVHHLKYRGVVAAGRILADAMAPLVGDDAVLVPLRRLGWRRLRYGVDPAVELASMLSSITGRPVLDVLWAPMWGKARAGRLHGFAPRFRIRAAVHQPVILIDDVVTTGATLAAAARLFRMVEGGVTATSSVGCRPRVP